MTTEERKDFSAADRKELAKKGAAMPDGSYPIVTIADLKNAIQAYGRATNKAAVKAHIIKRAKALGATDLLPADWTGSTKQATLGEMLEEYRRDLADHGLAMFMTVPIAEVRGMDGGTGDGSWTIQGQAALFSTRTTLIENKKLRVTEEITPGAFTDVLGDPNRLTHLNHGHNMNQVMASSDVPASQVGGLELRQNSSGLGYFSRVNPAVSYIRDVATLMKDGVIRGASFKFKIDDEDRTEGELEDGRRGVHYQINRVSHLYDVCVCAQGAYRQATSTVRSLAPLAVLLDSRSDEDSLGDPRRTPSVGASSAAPSMVGPGGDSDLSHWERRVAAMRNHIRIAEKTLRT